MKVLLISRDASSWGQELQESVRGNVEVLMAGSLEQARRLFADNSDIDVIVTSDSVQHELDALEFVVEVRRGSSVLMVASCWDGKIGQRFVEAGCHESMARREVPDALSDFALSLAR